MAKNQEALALAANHLLAVGIMPREARTIAKGMVKDAAAAARGEPGEGSGETVLRNLKTNKAEVYEARLSEGVTDDDIRNYWDKGGVYQRVCDAINELDRGALFVKEMDDAKERGVPDDEAPAIAARQVRKHHAFYGDPSAGDGADAPLCPELRERINNEITHRLFMDSSAFLAELDAYTSLNAWARHTILSTA